MLNIILVLVLIALVIAHFVQEAIFRARKAKMIADHHAEVDAIWARALHARDIIPRRAS